MNILRRILWWQHPPKPLGERGEDAAVKFLNRKRYTIVARGRRSGHGELDVVAVDPRGQRGRTIVFVEVKTRSSLAAGHPAESVDEKKQRKLTSLAMAFLKGKGLLEHPARFDVIAVLWPPEAKNPTSNTSKTPSNPPAKGKCSRKMRAEDRGSHSPTVCIKPAMVSPE